ncbi:hypothetical protein NMG60_11008946 [Bertholletia excelsa]
MEAQGSYGTSWADQWDYSNPDPHPENKSSGSAKSSSRFSDGLCKTKEVASTGVKKVKGGASVGMRWIKVKYHKTTRRD